MSDFYKYHCSGNDYIVIDPRKLKFKLRLNTRNIKLICNRKYGIGSDGILFGPIIKKDKIAVKIFNSGGSEAEKSGNGIRIFALYLYETGYVKNKNFDIYVTSGVTSIEILDLRSALIKVNMGRYPFPRYNVSVNSNYYNPFLHKEIELFGKKEKINYVNVGNPHCVIIKDSISEKYIKKLGPVLENHILFPNGTNVQLLQVLDKSNIKIEIWERGVGYTLSSGTSSLATSCIAYKLGLVDHKITVHMAGGDSSVDIVGKELFLIGNVSQVNNGVLRNEFINKLLNY